MVDRWFFVTYFIYKVENNDCQRFIALMLKCILDIDIFGVISSSSCLVDKKVYINCINPILSAICCNFTPSWNSISVFSCTLHLIGSYQHLTKTISEEYLFIEALYCVVPKYFSCNPPDLLPWKVLKCQNAMHHQLIGNYKLLKLSHPLNCFWLMGNNV